MLVVDPNAFSTLTVKEIRPACKVNASILAQLKHVHQMLFAKLYHTFQCVDVRPDSKEMLWFSVSL